MGKYQVGDLYNINLTGLAIGGEAVGRLEDLVVFVPYGAPGDEVEVRLIDVKKNYARGVINRVINGSPDRVEPPCPIFYKCGGCQLQQMTYESQVREKKKMVEEVLRHLGGLHEASVETIVEAPNPYGYRNKMQVVAACKPFLHSNKVAVPYFGLYARKTHRVVRMDECAIQHPLANKLLKAAREAITKLQWEVFDENTGEGFLRYLMTRVSVARNEVILVIVSTINKIPGMQEFAQMMTRKAPGLKGILVNVNNKRTNIILGGNTRLVHGEDHLIEEIEGIKYHISPHSFFQVNPAQTANLFKILDRFIEPGEKDVVLDAYCGVGAIAMWLANKVQSVIGIEEISQAKKDAMASARLNDINNLEFYVGQVEKILPEIYHKGLRIDKLILDPPRRGCEEIVLDLISKMRVPRLAYVSCNPATFARDLSILKNRGYRLEKCVLIDMFPQTYHVECVGKLVYQPSAFIRRVKMETPADRQTVSIPNVPVKETDSGRLDVEPKRRGPSYHSDAKSTIRHEVSQRKEIFPDKEMKRKFFGAKVLKRKGKTTADLPEKAPDTTLFKKKAPPTSRLKLPREKTKKKLKPKGEHDTSILPEIAAAARSGSLVEISAAVKKAADTGELEEPETFRKKTEKPKKKPEKAKEKFEEPEKKEKPPAEEPKKPETEKKEEKPEEKPEKVAEEKPEVKPAPEEKKTKDKEEKDKKKEKGKSKKRKGRSKRSKKRKSKRKKWKQRKKSR